MKQQPGFRFQMRASDMKPRKITPRRAPFASANGRLRKVACLGGGRSLPYAPFDDPTWELWAHASCRHLCRRDPDLLWDLHPPELWRNPKKKTWDPDYPKFLAKNRTPIMMQEEYPDVPASMRYPLETIVTEFPKGYMANHLAYMVALALIEGVTHIGVFGCDYSTGSEYGAQRGCAEYWLGVAEGRGVQVMLPPLCDLLQKPSLLYGYESHPNGIRDKSYIFSIGPKKATPADMPTPLVPVNDPNVPPLRDLGVPPDPDGFTKAMAQIIEFEKKESA